MLAIKFIVAGIAVGAYMFFATGCVTVGYDFLRQQATVTMSPSTKGFKK